VSLLFVTGEYPPDVGGVADYTRRLRDELEVRGWRSNVLSRTHVKRWDARSLLAVLRAAPRAGVVHIQFQAAAFDLLGDVCVMPMLLHRVRPNVKVVTTFHDTRVPYLFPKAGPWRAKAVRLLARSSDAVVAADERDLRMLGVGGFSVPIGSNVDCSPPAGFNREEFRSAHFDASPETLVVAYFGMLNASKGLDLLFDTFARFPEDARLLLLGGEVGASDPTNAVTAAQVHRRMGPRVIQTGWLQSSALSSHLVAADVALLPYADGASARRGSLLACAAHGLPIVSTLPAALEVADAILAVDANPAALADAVRHVVVDSAKWRAASTALAQRHSWNAIADAHVAIYSSLTT
jgi:glycosyltransferase involved in cell wall biosynthesis